ncbi:helix-turn-helix domain-containing protein [Amycolatopsis sp. NPDC051903]|uniref:helix-turn-helix domain-containing protein n=1 Tax=Amycolatopsis sp. NPDC051903 TaxID=3363936 RepID=UPI0037B00549
MTVWDWTPDASARFAVTSTTWSPRPWPALVKRKVGYTWRLREIMATRGVFTAAELVPLLQERGIDLSASQVHRLVPGTPERLSLQVLSAFCDTLGRTPADLVAITAENAGVRPSYTCSRCGQESRLRVPVSTKHSTRSGSRRPAPAPGSSARDGFRT